MENHSSSVLQQSSKNGVILVDADRATPDDVVVRVSQKFAADIDWLLLLSLCNWPVGYEWAVSHDGGDGLSLLESDETVN